MRSLQYSNISNDTSENILILVVIFNFLIGPRLDGPLKCFSCGKLGSHDCEAFDVSDPSHVKTCQKDEVCLIYSWMKSASKRGKYNIL